MLVKNFKQRVMFWTKQHVLFLREILSKKPYNYPKCFKDSIAAWAVVEKTLTGCKDPIYILSIQNL